jgi:hypothetical protein
MMTRRIFFAVMMTVVMTASVGLGRAQSSARPAQ